MVCVGTKLIDYPLYNIADVVETWGGPYLFRTNLSTLLLRTQMD